MLEQQHDTSSAEPIASRPRVPKGYKVPQSTEGLLPWSYARQRLEAAKNYWVCTANASGKPHAMPLWGAWVDDQFYFEGHPLSRWGRNLTVNPQVSVHLEDGTQVVIVEGTVEDVNDIGDVLYQRVTDAYAAKYDYRPQDHGFFVLRPHLAFAWSHFPSNDVTRWRFDLE